MPTAKGNEAATLEWWRRQSVTMWMVGLQLMVGATVREGNQCINSVKWKASMGMALLPVLRVATLKASPRQLHARRLRRRSEASDSEPLIHRLVAALASSL